MSKDLRQIRNSVRVLPLAISYRRTVDMQWTQKVLAQRATRTDVAQQAGIRISASTIAMIETGERQPSLAVAEAIAAAFDVPLGVFAERLDLETETEAA